jgi:two-component system LytT family response regulator
MNVIIIDDESGPAESLKIMLGEIGTDINCLGVANNVLEGIKLINANKPQAIFLDINMPQHTGFDLLDALGNTDMLIVFTTAHEEYAIKAIKRRAFDYLLKPIDTDELKACVGKIKKELEAKHKKKGTATLPKPLQIQIVVKEGLLLLKQEEIVRVEAAGSYAEICMADGKKHTVTKNLKAMEEMLDNVLFFRCHNSHIINLHKIKKVLKTEGLFVEMDDSSVVEVSRNKKDELLSKL